MNNFGKVKLKKESGGAKFRDSIIFILIFILCISTIVTIQIRSQKRSESTSEKSRMVQSLDVEKDESAYRDEGSADVFSTYTDITHEASDDESNDYTDALPANDSEQNATRAAASEAAASVSVPAKALEFSAPVAGIIIKEFSDSQLLYSKTMDDWRIHLGIDISAKIGTDVMACSDGIVEDVKIDEEYGNTVTVRHSDSIVSVYSNLAKQGCASIGEAVTKNSVIGVVSDSSTYEILDEPHLHFAMCKDGVFVDPAAYISFE